VGALAEGGSAIAKRSPTEDGLKRSVVFKILGLLCLTCLPPEVRGDGDPALPSLAHPEQVGRLMYFRGPRPLTRFAPLAFSTSLTCEPRLVGPDRTCIIRITNDLSPDDLAQMTGLQAGNPRLQFTPLSSEQMEEIHEDFQKMDRDIPMAGVKPPGTLALSRDSYVAISFNKSKKIVERLLAAYEKDGLGVFSAKFSFDAERTEDYLELIDTSPLKSLMERSSLGVKPSDLWPSLESALHAGGLTANNLTEAEAVAIAYRTVLANFFRLTRESLVFPRSERLGDLPDSVILVNETQSPIRGRCQATLPIKHGAQATISCREASP
jgi:hypothetical protein